MRMAKIVLAGVLLAGMAGFLDGCHTVSDLTHGRDIRPKAKAASTAKDCTQGGPGCHPTDRRQYYDDRTARYYYFDPATGRYYWENGDPRF